MQHRCLKVSNYVACTKEAVGAIGLNFFPHPKLQQLLGRTKPMGSYTIGLTVCAECFKTVTVGGLIAAGVPVAELEAATEAQEGNNGHMVHRDSTSVELVPFDSEDWKLFEKIHRATQPKEAGDGKRSEQDGVEQPATSGDSRSAGEADGDGDGQAVPRVLH